MGMGSRVVIRIDGLGGGGGLERPLRLGGGLYMSMMVRGLERRHDGFLFLTRLFCQMRL